MSDSAASVEPNNEKEMPESDQSENQSNQMLPEATVEVTNQGQSVDDSVPSVRHDRFPDDGNQGTVTTATSLSSLKGTSQDKTAIRACGQEIGQTKLRWCTVFSMIFAVLGAVMAFTFPIIYSTMLNKELSLQPGTKQYEMWLNPPVPMYMRFYFFNVTNSYDVINHQAKPNLHELGPYTFQEKHIRTKIQPHDNYTLSFQQQRQWHFVPEMSKGSLTDSITTINVPLVGAVHAMRYQSRFMKEAFNGILKVIRSDLFVTKTVSEFTFDGYSDPLIDLGKRFPMGDIPPIDKFGWFYQRNNSDYYDGVFNIFTGVDDINKFGEMDMWNYTRHTNYYESYCGMINGSFGEGWAPRLTSNKTISMYITDICRSITLDFTDVVKNEGVSSYRFTATERVFANATENPDNWCFCSEGYCNPSGVGNSSTCRFNSPVFVSFPHFYLADPYYSNFVMGLNPQKDLHEFHIDLEPEMAAPTSVRARLQINILIEPDAQIDMFRHLKPTYLPAIWFEICADVTPELGQEINMALNLSIIGTASFFAFFCLNLVIVIASCIIIVRRQGRGTIWRQREDAEHLTTSSIGPL